MIEGLDLIRVLVNAGLVKFEVNINHAPTRTVFMQTIFCCFRDTRPFKALLILYFYDLNRFGRLYNPSVV